MIPHFTVEPCWIATLPNEILFQIIACFEKDWDRDSILNLSRSCKRFNALVNERLYSSISLSVKEEKWDAVVRVLPKFGHYTKEIYLEAPMWDSELMKRVVFNNLRAIGDYCPRLERLDLNYPARLNLNATPADLPPKLETETDEMRAASPSATATSPSVTVTSPAVSPTVITSPQTLDQMHVDASSQTEDGELFGGEDDEDDNDEENESEMDEDEETMEEPPPPPIPSIHPTQQQRINQEKRLCAELDYIIANCKHLKNFSMQWTGPQALERFYFKIRRLQAIRLWDRNIRDEHLIKLGRECPYLERVYIDAQDCFAVRSDGLIGFLKTLKTREHSRLKRFGISAPQDLLARVPGHGQGMMDEDEGDLSDDEEVMDDVENNEQGQSQGTQSTPTAPPSLSLDFVSTPMYKFLDTLSSRHPRLERLALIECEITDQVMMAFSAFENLQSLDLQRPHRGLTSLGIDYLVHSFKGKRLRSLDLSRHLHINEGDVQRLTGDEGIGTLRYIRVAGCPHLRDKYLVDEWVHPDDFVCDEGTWRPRAGEGRCLLEIGNGWKESWSDVF
jgi:hypothetical protein